MQIIHLLREMGKPVVFDADSLHIIKGEPGLVKGWRNAILTPNRAEFARLASAVGVEVNEKNPAQQLQEVRADLGFGAQSRAERGISRVLDVKSLAQLVVSLWRTGC